MKDRNAIGSARVGNIGRGAGTALLASGSLATAIGAASCCALPTMLGTIGLGSAWLGGLALLAGPYRLYLLAAATGCFGAGGLLLWRKTRVARASGCARPSLDRAAISGFLFSALLITLTLAYG
jgi:mercuric ion transport protein